MRYRRQPKFYSGDGDPPRLRSQFSCGHEKFLEKVRERYIGNDESTIKTMMNRDKLLGLGPIWAEMNVRQDVNMPKLMLGKSPSCISENAASSSSEKRYGRHIFPLDFRVKFGLCNLGFLYTFLKSPGLIH